MADIRFANGLFDTVTLCSLAKIPHGTSRYPRQRTDRYLSHALANFQPTFCSTAAVLETPLFKDTGANSD